MATREHIKTAQKARDLLFEAYVEFADGEDHLIAVRKAVAVRCPRHRRRRPAAWLGI